MYSLNAGLRVGLRDGDLPACAPRTRPSATTTSGPDSATTQVFLLGRTPDSRSIVAHEIGHAIMDDIYEDAYPATPNCSGHKVDTASSAGCAWTEGFADWLPLAVYGWKVRSGRIGRYKLRKERRCRQSGSSAGSRRPRLLVGSLPSTWNTRGWHSLPWSAKP